MSDTALHSQATQMFRRRRRISLAVPALIIAYFAYVFVAFDIAGLAQRVSLDNARTLVSDAYSYKTHVTRDNRDGSVEVSIEGERKGRYPQGTGPDWVTLGDQTIIDLRGGHIVTFGEAVTYDVPGYGLIVMRPVAGLPAVRLRDYGGFRAAGRVFETRPCTLERSDPYCPGRSCRCKKR